MKAKTPLKKKYSIFHWDTFDNHNLLIAKATTLKQAEAKVKKKYGDRISPNGADKVDIVDQKGKVVRQFAVT